MTGRHVHRLRAALGGADVAAALGAALLAYTTRFGVLARWLPVSGRTDVLPDRYLAALPVAVLLLLLATAAAGLYDTRRAVRPPGVADALRISGYAVAALATVALLYWSEFQYSRATLFVAGAAYGPACAILRRAALAALDRVARADASSGALLVGGGAPAHALGAALERTPWPTTRIAAVLAVGPDTAAPGLRRLAGLEEACAELARGTWREVIVALPAAHSAEVPQLLARLEQTTADVRLVPDLGDAILVNASATVMDGVPLVSLRERPLYGVRAAAKRALDVALAVTLLVVLAPVLLLLGVLVRATSRGPALYAQERMGIDGSAFRMWKLRTMRLGAEDRTGPVFARSGDPRITPVGRLLRRFSLDELPQLWNVVRGDMSLVGPRPEREPFIEEFRRRLPG